MKRSMPSTEADKGNEDSDGSQGLSFAGDMRRDTESGTLSPSEDESVEDSGSDDGLNFKEEEEDLVGSEDDVPDELLHFSSEEEDEKWGGATSTILGKRKGGKHDALKGHKKKRKLKDLPLFASAEDYEGLIDAQPEDNL